MAHSLDEAARATVIEMITHKDLSPQQIMLLQAGLRTLDLYGAKQLLPRMGEETGKGIGEFLLRPENENYIGRTSGQAKDAVRSYSELMQKEPRKTPEITKKAGMYRDLFETSRKTAPSGSAETVLSQPNSLTGDDIITLKKGLGLKSENGSPPDGFFTTATTRAVVRHLDRHPADWATIGTPVLRLMENNTTSLAETINAPKPREYFDRVSGLLKELGYKDGTFQTDRATSGATYELQTLLRAGGYFKNEPDGAPGNNTYAAVEAFIKDRTRHGYRADAGGIDPAAAQYAESNADGSGIKPPATPDPVQETTRVASAAPPAGFKPFG